MGPLDPLGPFGPFGPIGPMGPGPSLWAADLSKKCVLEKTDMSHLNANIQKVVVCMNIYDTS